MKRLFSILAFCAVSIGAFAQPTPTGGVTQIIAGNNVTITPANGAGRVTINASGGGSGSPGGANTQVQFNDSGAFGGDAGMTYVKATDTLTLAGGLTVPLLQSSGADLVLGTVAFPGIMTLANASGRPSFSTDNLLVRKDSNADTVFRVQNATSGTGATALFAVTSNSGNSLTVYATSTAYTATARLPAAASIFDSTSPTMQWNVDSAKGMSLTSSGLSVTATTASSSTTTGSGIFGGGIGVAGAGYFGGTLAAAPGASDVVLIGTTTDTSSGKVQVVGVSGNLIALRATDTTTGAADTGGNLIIVGHNGSAAANFANVSGLKENATVGNNASYMALGTRTAGASMLEKWRITSTGILQSVSGADGVIRGSTAGAQLTLAQGSTAATFNGTVSTTQLTSTIATGTAPLVVTSTTQVANLNAATAGSATSAASLSISGQSGLLSVTGLASTNRIKTVRDAADTLLELGGSYTPTGVWTSMALTSPAVTTALTTPSTTFALANTTATTVNAFGAATTVNTGAAATQIWNFGGSTTASEFRFLEPSGSGTNYSAFKAVAQAGNITYSLPPSTTAGGVFTDVAGNGVLTMVVPSGSGTVSSGTTNTVAKYTGTTTVGNSAITDDGTTMTYSGTGGIVSAGSATGIVQVTGATSGALKITGADAMAQTVTISLAAQTTGAATLTLPDFANVNQTFSFIGKAETLTLKTLTAPKFASGGFIADANGNELIIFTTTASAVNEWTFANGATGVNPTLTASGETNVGLNFQVKGTGVYRLLATASGPTDLRLFEDTDNGANYASLIAPASLSGDIAITLPNAASTLPIFGQQITFAGPTAPRTITVPDAAFTVARTDASNTFNGVQTMTSPALTTPAITGLATGSGVASAATASTLVTRDSSANINADNVNLGYTTTVTAAGVTTLTVDSTYLQFFTGTTTQDILLPVTSTLVLGYRFMVVNNSTGAVTIASSGSNTILIVAANTSAIFTCILTSGTGVASWDAEYFGVIPATGKSLAVSNTLTLAGTDSTTMTMPSTSQTIVGLTATQTLTSKKVQVSAALGTDDTYDASLEVAGLNAGATIAQWEAVYIGGSSTYLLADANGSGTYPAVGLAVAAYSNTNPAIVVTLGSVRNDAWNWTPGGNIYLSTTAGALTQTPPATTGDKVQVIGVALTADIMLVRPGTDYGTAP